MKPAGFFIRLLATLIDVIIFLAAYLVVFLVIVILANFGVVSVDDLPQYKHTVDVLDYSYRILFLYFCLDCESSQKFQGTLGKYIMKIKIVNEDGSKLGLIKAASRLIFKIFSLLLVGVGFFMILLTRKKLGLHDMILSTKVVYR